MKRVNLVIAALVFGLVLATAVAWCLALRSVPRVVRLGSYSLANRVDPERWRSRDGSFVSAGMLVGSHEDFGISTRVTMKPVSDEQVTTWSRSFRFEAGWPWPSMAMSRHEYGLPPRFALLHERDARPSNHDVRFSGAVPITSDRALPLVPLWPGLLMNVGLFAAVLLFVLSLCGALRSLSSRRSASAA